MIKYLVVLLNSVILFLYGFFVGDEGIVISGNFPNSMVVNQEILVDIKITKGKMSGFAKFQLDMPKGFTIREVDNQGASFSSNNGIGKWIWSSLPSDEELIIKIGLTAEESALGNKIIAAKYSYVVNNEKQQVEMPAVEIQVLNIGEVATTNDSTKNTPSNQEPTSKDSSSSATGMAALISSNAEPIGNIEIVRTYSPTGNPKEILVDVLIKKGATAGFARYSDDLEDGFSAKSVKTDGSSFSVADKKIKFVWVNVPAKDELHISYFITRFNSIKPTVLNGEYSYLEHNQSKKAKPSMQTIPFEEILLGEEKIAEVPVERTENSVQEKKIENPTEEPIVADKTEGASAVETKLNANQSNAKFCVQVGAFNNSKVQVGTLKRKFKIYENMRSEMQDGYSKFIVGSHSEYKDARQHRETMINKNGVKSSFVVAYNNGARITVQEALMIGNQKWFK